MFKKFAPAVALLLAAAPLSAQVTTGAMHFSNGGSVDDGHYYVGWYNGTLNADPVQIDCVDFFHEVHNGENWDVYKTPLKGGDLSHTRLGITDPTNALSKYEQAAYLSSLYTGATHQQTIDIQHAIWRTFGASDAYLVNAGSNSYMSMASSNYMSSGVDFRAYYILTDSRVYDNRNDPRYNGSGTAQEFIMKGSIPTTTPEPSSMALLGTGLIGLVPLARRRRK